MADERNVWTIVAWHGMSPNLKQLLLNAGCVEQEYAEGKTRFVFNGTLDDFGRVWKAKFMVNWEDCWIAITQFSNFGQR